MIFQSNEWKLVSEHVPLRKPEINALRESIIQDALIAQALIGWGMAMREMVEWSITLQKSEDVSERIARIFQEPENT